MAGLRFLFMDNNRREADGSDEAFWRATSMNTITKSSFRGWIISETRNGKITGTPFSYKSGGQPVTITVLTTCETQSPSWHQVVRPARSKDCIIFASVSSGLMLADGGNRDGRTSLWMRTWCGAMREHLSRTMLVQIDNAFSSSFVWDSRGLSGSNL